ncbi:Unknown protein, partial [Striga hermonthica]
LIVKIQTSNDNSKDGSTINEIKRILTPGQMDILRGSAFGKFLDLPHSKIQIQLLNHILLREVYQPRTDEIWFDFGGRLFRFGIEEFALITGLKCTGTCKKLNIAKVSQGLYDNYFSGVLLTRSCIRVQFLKKSWTSDEDAVKFAKLHLLANFLMGSQDSHRFDRCYLDIIDSADFDDYAWGTDVFEFTFHYLRMSMKNREQMHNRGKSDGAGYMYRCYGFILALQIWFYEICDTAEGVVCTSIGANEIPRMLKWEVRDTYNYLYIQRAFSNLDSSKNVTPTLEEKQSLLLHSFFQKKNEFNRNETHTTSTSQPTSNSEIMDRLNSITSDVENLKKLFFDFSRRVLADLELFKNTFIVSLIHSINNLGCKRRIRFIGIYQKLKPPFDFNVTVVTDKSWFYTIHAPGKFLDSS